MGVTSEGVTLELFLVSQPRNYLNLHITRCYKFLKCANEPLEIQPNNHLPYCLP